MHPTDLHRALRKHGIGRAWRRYSGIPLFDRDYHVPTPTDMNKIVQKAMRFLAGRGLTPETDYAKNGADCDNWAGWIWSEVTQLWALKHEGQPEFPELAFFQALVKGHALNLGATTGGPKVWDYGQLKDFDVRKIYAVR